MAWRQHAAIQSRGQHFPDDKTIGTPPGGSAPLHAYATLPSLRVNRNELSVGLSRESVFVLPLRHLGYCHALGRITPGTFLLESLCSVFGLMFQSEQSRWRLRHCSDIPVKSYTALKSHLAPRPVTSTSASGTNRSGIPFQNEASVHEGDFPIYID